LWIAFAAAPLVLGPVWHAMDDRSQGWLHSVAGCVLVLLLVVSTLSDLTCRKIPNWATYSAALWAVLINALGSVSSGMSKYAEFSSIGEQASSSLGAIGLRNCLAGAALGFFIMLLMYRLSGGGAGDVKLAAAIGALAGPMPCLSALINSYIVAGVFIVSWLVWEIGPLALITTLARIAGSRMLPGWIAPPAADYRDMLHRPVPLAAFFAVGTIAAVWQHRMF